MRDSRGREFPADDVARAVALIRASIPDADRARIAAEISADPDGWSIDHHFGAGADVRNLLREHGFGERWPFTADLDTVWAPLVELAVK